MDTHELEKFDESIIRDRIYSIRGFQVMLDRDLAELYGVGTKVLNQAVKRNKERFPASFCFQILLEEYEMLLFSADSKENESLITRSQIVTSILAKRNIVKMKKGGRTYLPYAFTEQGVAMLAGVLKSEIAVKISIKIIETFVEMRKFIQSNAQVFQRLDTLAHDRFIIIDDKNVYHFGASLKDLGKKWFAFSKIEKSDLELLSKLEKV